MKSLNLLSLTLVALCGCGDSTTTDRTASTTDPVDAERYEVNRPVDQAPALGHDPASPMPSDDASVNSGATPSDETGLEADSGADLSPLDQNENQADVDITAKIRSQITDTEMSIAARNVEIVTRNGQVTLSGEVPNQEEKNRIEEIAVSIAGEENVTNQLEIEE